MPHSPACLGCLNFGLNKKMTSPEMSPECLADIERGVPTKGQQTWSPKPFSSSFSALFSQASPSLCLPNLVYFGLETYQLPWRPGFQVMLVDYKLLPISPFWFVLVNTKPK